MGARSYFFVIPVILLLWIALDLSLPFRSDFRNFDALEVGKLDAQMWRSYYEKKPVTLFFQMSSLMRKQFKAPFWRSHLMAYYFAKAAFLFKKGQGRKDYDQALPYLKMYFHLLHDLSDRPFNLHRLASIELEWWIIRREKDKYHPSDWEKILAEEGEIIYSIPAYWFKIYARERVAAMVFRDDQGENIQDEDWKKITAQCELAWLNFHQAIHLKNSKDPIQTLTER